MLSHEKRSASAAHSFSVASTLKNLGQEAQQQTNVLVPMPARERRKTGAVSGASVPTNTRPWPFVGSVLASPLLPRQEQNARFVCLQGGFRSTAACLYVCMYPKKIV